MNLLGILQRRGIRQRWKEGRVERCPHPFVVLDRETGEYLHVPCRRRRCVWCGPNIWAKLRRADFYSGLAGVGMERLRVMFVTAPGGELDCEAWNEGASGRWHHLFTLMRQHFASAELEFWKVGELQRRGAIHYHVVVRSRVPIYISHGLLQRLAMMAGFGQVCGVEGVRPYAQPVRVILAYLGKYLTKACEAWPKGMHVVTKSYGWRLVWEDRRLAKTPGRCVWFSSLTALVVRVLEEDLRWKEGATENRGPTLALQPTFSGG